MQMKSAFVAVLLAGTFLPARGAAYQLSTPTNAFQSVLKNLRALGLKIVDENERMERVNREKLDYYSREMAHAKSEKEKAEEDRDEAQAKVNREIVEIAKLTEEIDKVAFRLAYNQEKLANLTRIRREENQAFHAAEKDMEGAVNALDRAKFTIGTQIRQHEQQFWVGFDQQTFQVLLQTVNTMVEAGGLQASDTHKLTALIQEGREDSDQEPAINAPQGAKYENSQNEIYELISDLFIKAQKKLDMLQREEAQAQHDYDMLKMDLDDMIEADTNELARLKGLRTEAEARKAQYEEDLRIAVAAVKHWSERFEALFREEQQWRKDYRLFEEWQEKEGNLITMCKDLVTKAMGRVGLTKFAAVQGASNSISLVQLQNTHHAQVQVSTQAQVKVVNMLKNLAHEHHSIALSRLASQVKTMLRYASADGKIYGKVGEEDPFAKVKGLISDMIKKLRDQITFEKGEVKYCEDTMYATKEQLEGLGLDVKNLDAKWRQMSALEVSSKNALDDTVARMVEAAQAWVEEQKIFSEVKAVHEQTEIDLKAGMEGNMQALNAIKAFYGLFPKEDPGEFQMPTPEPWAETAAQAEAAEAEGGGASLVQHKTSKKQGVSFVQHKTSQKSDPTQFLGSDGKFHIKDPTANSDTGTALVNVMLLINDQLTESLTHEEETFADETRDHNQEENDFKTQKAVDETDQAYYTEQLRIGQAGAKKADEEGASKKSIEESVSEFYLALKTRCEKRPLTYEQMKEKRDAEIAGLKEAKSILEDETVTGDAISNPGGYDLAQQDQQRSLRGFRRHGSTQA